MGKTRIEKYRDHRENEWKSFINSMTRGENPKVVKEESTGKYIYQNPDRNIGNVKISFDPSDGRGWSKMENIASGLENENHPTIGDAITLLEENAETEDLKTWVEYEYASGWDKGTYNNPVGISGGDAKLSELKRGSNLPTTSIPFSTAF